MEDRYGGIRQHSEKQDLLGGWLDLGTYEKF